MCAGVGQRATAPDHRRDRLFVVTGEELVQGTVVPRPLGLELQGVRVAGREQVVRHLAGRGLGGQPRPVGLDGTKEGFVVRAHPGARVSLG